MNISVPDDLAERVRARDLPISSICQDALRKAVRQAEQTEKIMIDIEVVIERLRGTQDEERNRTVEQGRRLGIRWAKERATAAELEQVATDRWHGLRGFGDADLSITEFYNEMQEKGFATFNAEYADENTESFFEGAREIWDAVADKL
ncbi:type II toxin-antitoxin system CcdA family antitoxin [Streptacidiphilus sp. MAP12-16]|uniref:type II toxin-antitoxin system CcdA family antitoxin n=1 Tax=Streptacidiphilus sp. MAP12-16 TaxID=3156300 RepID=UPI003516A3CF